MWWLWRESGSAGSTRWCTQALSGSKCEGTSRASERHHGRLIAVLTFLLASALLTIAPGPDNIFVMTQSALYGRKAGTLITLGLCTGLIVHTTLVALGVAAIFMVSTTAFVALKLAGAAYLLYLAWQLLRAAALPPDRRKPPALTPRQLYFRGILMNISNPKVAIFFLAFLPQFAEPEAGSMPLQ